MKHFYLFLTALLAVMWANAAPTVAPEKFNSSIPYKGEMLYSVSDNYINIVSTGGSFTCFYVDGGINEQRGSVSQVKFNAIKSLNGDIHYVEIVRGDDTREGFYFTSLNDFFQSGNLLYGVSDEASKTVSVIGVAGEPVYVEIPGEVENNNQKYRVTEISSTSFYNELSVRRIRTGESVSTIRDICTRAGKTAIPSDLNYFCMICDKAVTQIISTHILADRVVFLGDNPPIGFMFGPCCVPNNNYNFSAQTVYPNLPNMFESEGLLYVPTDMGERKCILFDWNANALNNTSVSIGRTVNYRGVEFTVENVAPHSLSGLPLTHAVFENAGDIEGYALFHCDKLQELHFKNDGDVLCGAAALNKVIFENKGDVGGGRFLSECIEFRNEGYIASHIAERCESLKKVVIANGGGMGEFAFSKCISLASVELENVTDIGQYAFNECTSLKSVNMPEMLQSIGASAFFGCSALSNVTLNEGLKTIDDYAFKNCSSLTGIDIPGSVAVMGYNIVEGCSSLENVRFSAASSSVYPVGDGTVRPQKSLIRSKAGSEEATYTLKRGEVLSFGAWINQRGAHKSYPTLSVYLNDNKIGTVQHFENNSYYYKFNYEAYRDGEVRVKVAASGYDIPDFGLINIWIYPPSQPNDGLSLGFNDSKPTFSDLPVKNVVIDRQLYYSPDRYNPASPFSGNTSLEQVTVGDNVVEMTTRMFQGCSALKECYLGNKITEIPTQAFSGCSSLKSFSIGAAVEKIWMEAFAGCTGIADFSSYSIIPPVCGQDALSAINKWECTLHVPENTVPAYQAADQWKEFFFMEDDLVAGIDDVIDDATVEDSQSASGIFSIDGVCISRECDEETIGRLSPGVYIINGRKVLK